MSGFFPAIPPLQRPAGRIAASRSAFSGAGSCGSTAKARGFFPARAEARAFSRAGGCGSAATARGFFPARAEARAFSRAGGCGSTATARGFTLIEILAVIMLIALILTVVSVSVGSGLSGARVSAAGRELVAAMRHTRGQAIVKRESQVFSIDLEKRRYTAPGRKETELPKDMEIRVLTAREELIGDGTAGIRFFPDGSSTGGRVTLQLGEREWIIEVQWLTGEVVLFPPGSGSG